MPKVSIFRKRPREEMEAAPGPACPCLPVMIARFSSLRPAPPALHAAALGSCQRLVFAQTQSWEEKSAISGLLPRRSQQEGQRREELEGSTFRAPSVLSKGSLAKRSSSGASSQTNRKITERSLHALPRSTSLFLLRQNPA